MREIFLQMKCISPDELAIATQLPDLAKKAALKALAPRPATQDDNIAAEKTRSRPELNYRLTPQAGAIEQDRLGRQKFEDSARADRQRLRDLRGSFHRAVDLLGRCRGYVGYRP